MIEPNFDRIVVKRDTPKNTTDSGLLLPTPEKIEKANIGTVVAVGKGYFLDSGVFHELPLKIGMRVVFTKYGGQDVTLEDGNKYTVLRESEIYGVLGE
jgi:chaperonin GroES